MKDAGSPLTAQAFRRLRCLLEALEEIVSAADGDGWSQLDADLRRARAAIAKAKGGEA